MDIPGDIEAKLFSLNKAARAVLLPRRLNTRRFTKGSLADYDSLIRNRQVFIARIL